MGGKKATGDRRKMTRIHLQFGTFKGRGKTEELKKGDTYISGANGDRLVWFFLFGKLFH